MKKDLSNKLKKGFQVIKFEISYLTGIGWNYESKDKYKDFASRKMQIHRISPNNVLVRSTDWPYIPYWKEDRD